jgi:hypothetical protein
MNYACYFLYPQREEDIEWKNGKSATVTPEDSTSPARFVTQCTKCPVLLGDDEKL